MTRWKLIVAALLVAAGVAWGGWLIWSVMRPQVERAERQTETAQDDSAGRGLEAQGADETTAAVEHHYAHTREIEVRTHALQADAAVAPDAASPLDDRGARLGAHDRFLCEQAPRSCAPAAGGDASDG